MTRSRKSAKAAGTRFERSIADCLARWVDDRIDRRAKTGSKDRGDIGGVRHMGGRVVVECKDVARLALGVWVTEADVERGNDDAIAGFVVHKRARHGDPLDQYVTGTVRDLVALLTGERPDTSTDLEGEHMRDNHRGGPEAAPGATDGVGRVSLDPETGDRL